MHSKYSIILVCLNTENLGKWIRNLQLRNKQICF